MDNLEDYYESVLNLKNEIKKLNLDLKDKEFILERTKEYLFILENENELKNKQINDLENDADDRIIEIINDKENQIETLKIEYENEINKINEKKFIFSIIIPIYNTEKYLSEAIDSVINQSFIFDNVEILLIEGGSSDNCKKICEEYVNKYPNNIKMIILENTTLSFKRNAGLKIAQGKFINFLDSDDKLEPNTLNEIFYHFNKFGSEIDVISMPRWRFDAYERWMPFYNKYNKSRVVNIDKEYDFPITPTNSAFLRKSEALKFEFDERLVLSEDCNFMTKLILEKGKVGVVDSVKYLYRKRPEDNSVGDTIKNDKRYFMNGMEFHLKGLIKYSMEKYGKVLRYVQSALMYDLQWFFLQNTEKGVLNDDEIEQFHNGLHEVFQAIDDELILSQNLSKFIKYYMLSIKYDYPGFNINYDEDVILLNNGVLFDKLSNNKIVIENVSKENEIVGYFKFYSEKININAFENDKKLNVQITGVEKEVSISKIISYKFNFKINLDVFNGLDGIKFEITYDSNNYPIQCESKLVENGDN